MNDEAREAAFYQEHKDDPAVWGQPVESTEGPRRGRLGATITVRFAEEEADLIRRMAKEAHLTYSEVVRHAVDAYLRPRFTFRLGQANALFGQPQNVVQVAETVISMARQPEAFTANAGDLPRALIERK